MVEWTVIFENKELFALDLTNPIEKRVVVSVSNYALGTCFKP